MSFTRTITEQDLDAETRKFVQELSDTANNRDADCEADSMDAADGSCIDSRFGE